MRFITKKRVAAAATTIAIAGGGMAAYAYWTGGGAGTGSASTGTPAALVVHQTTSVASLFPGATPTALTGNFDNPNPGPVYVTSVSASVHAFSSQTDGSKPPCTEADFTIVGSPASVGANVAAGNGVGSWSGLTLQLVNNASGNQDNCKGRSVTIDYTAS